MKPPYQILDELKRYLVDAQGNTARFLIPAAEGKGVFKVLATWDLDWEHVSISLPRRCPTWAEMCRMKDLFWEPDEAVMQLHPPTDDYVNYHPFCLHLWRPGDDAVGAIPLPPSILVGPTRPATPT